MEVVELLREKSTAMCLPLSAVHVQTPNLEESVKRSVRNSISSSTNVVRVTLKHPCVCIEYY